MFVHIKHKKKNIQKRKTQKCQMIIYNYEL